MFSIILSLLITYVSAQHESLADKLYLRFLPANDAARALANAAIFAAETPITIRFTLMAGAAVYDSRAACHPVALSFFGTKDDVPPSFCTDDNNAILTSYTTYVAIAREFPGQARTYGQFLRKQGLEPQSNSRDRSTMNGWANYIGNRMADFFANDGWNSLGKLSNDRFPAPFQDYTNYQPVNQPYAKRPRKPLRWQPLPFEVDGLGRFAHQIHVTPQIAVAVDPLVLTQQDMNSRVTRSPYLNPDKYNKLNTLDRRNVQKRLNEMLRTSVKLTPGQIFLARWWDNKLFSTAGISAYYEGASGLSKFQVAQQFMGEMISQYDALIITWREKRRHDLARPRSLLQIVRPGQTVRSFVNEKEGVSHVSTEDWRPLIREQPHSEFPSGSAALCFAAMEHIQEYVKQVKGSVPDIKIRYPANTFPFNQQDVTVAYEDPQKAARGCAESRLWAGVHFRPSVEAGAKIGRGIGRIVLNHVLMLGRGKVPAGCARCQSVTASITPVAHVMMETEDSSKQNVSEEVF